MKYLVQIKNTIYSTQPFHYFYPQGSNNDDNNNNNNWKESWVDTIYSIANDIKHVKVVIPAIHKDIHFESGTRKIHNTKIRVEVLDPQPKFAGWTFFRSAFYQYNLDNNLNFSNKQLINLSRVLVNLFKIKFVKKNLETNNKKYSKKDENDIENFGVDEDAMNDNSKSVYYINNNLVVHSSVLNYQINFINNGDKEIDDIKISIKDEIKEHLHTLYNHINNSNGAQKDTILNCIEQFSSLYKNGESMEDIWKDLIDKFIEPIVGCLIDRSSQYLPAKYHKKEWEIDDLFSFLHSTFRSISNVISKLSKIPAPLLPRNEEDNLPNIFRNHALMFPVTLKGLEELNNNKKGEKRWNWLTDIFYKIDLQNVNIKFAQENSLQETVQETVTQETSAQRLNRTAVTLQKVMDRYLLRSYLSYEEKLYYRSKFFAQKALNMHNLLGIDDNDRFNQIKEMKKKNKDELCKDDDSATGLQFIRELIFKFKQQTIKYCCNNEKINYKKTQSKLNVKAAMIIHRLRAILEQSFAQFAKSFFFNSLIKNEEESALEKLTYLIEVENPFTKVVYKFPDSLSEKEFDDLLNRDSQSLSNLKDDSLDVYNLLKSHQWWSQSNNNNSNHNHNNNNHNHNHNNNNNNNSDEIQCWISILQRLDNKLKHENNQLITNEALNEWWNLFTQDKIEELVLDPLPLLDISFSSYCIGKFSQIFEDRNSDLDFDEIALRMVNDEEKYPTDCLIPIVSLNINVNNSKVETKQSNKNDVNDYFSDGDNNNDNEDDYFNNNDDNKDTSKGKYNERETQNILANTEDEKVEKIIDINGDDVDWGTDDGIVTGEEDKGIIEIEKITDTNDDDDDGDDEVDWGTDDGDDLNNYNINETLSSEDEDNPFAPKFSNYSFNNNNNNNNKGNFYNKDDINNGDDIDKDLIQKKLKELVEENDIKIDVGKFTLYLKKYILMKRSVKRIGLIKFMQFCYDKVEKIVPELHKQIQILDNSLSSNNSLSPLSDNIIIL